MNCQTHWMNCFFVSIQNMPSYLLPWSPEQPKTLMYWSTPCPAKSPRLLCRLAYFTSLFQAYTSVRFPALKQMSSYQNPVGTSSCWAVGGARWTLLKLQDSEVTRGSGKEMVTRLLCCNVSSQSKQVVLRLLKDGKIKCHGHTKSLTLIHHVSMLVCVLFPSHTAAPGGMCKTLQAEKGVFSSKQNPLSLLQYEMWSWCLFWLCKKSQKDCKQQFLHPSYHYDTKWHCLSF